MPNFATLSDENFILFAVKMYENPGCISLKEFHTDLDRIKYIKRLFRRYLRKKDIDALRLRLVLNHIIIIYNVFNAEAATRILFYKLEQELWPVLKPFLEFLGYMPDVVKGISKKEIPSSSIKMDKTIIEELRKI
jgi:hypothetical protein